MPSWAAVLIIALGGGLLMEGAMYALFPRGMKKAMREVQEQPDRTLRIIGLSVAMIGVLIVAIFIPKP